MKIGKKFFFFIIALLIIISIYGFFIEPYSVSVTRLEIPLPAGWEILDGSVAIQLSDLHIKRMGKRERRVLKIVEKVNPDFVFLTGDYVKWEGDYSGALNFLSGLKAKTGIFAVMGDYDYSDSRRSCLFCHEEGTGKPARSHHVHFLRNRIIDLPYGGGNLRLGGEDPEGYGYQEFSKELPVLHSEGPLIILSHSPLTFDLLKNDLNIIELSVDTHGGQVILPRWFYRLMGYEKNLKYNRGFFKNGNKMMYVSQGIGTSHMPFRFLRKPEVVVISFVQSKDVKENPIH